VEKIKKKEAFSENTNSKEKRRENKEQST